MDLPSLAERLGIRRTGVTADVLKQHTLAISKAKEYQRLIQQRRGVAGAIAMSTEAQAVGCVELGCKFYNLTLDPALTQKYSLSKTPAAYTKILSAMQLMLGLQSIITIRELAIQYGCIQISDDAKKILARYKEKVRQATVPLAGTNNYSSAAASAAATSNEVLNALDTRNVYPCVAFYLTCRHHKVPVDRKRLLITSNATEREFTRVCDSFYEHLPHLKPAVKVTAKTKGVKRKKEDEDATIVEEMNQRNEEEEMEEDERKSGERDDDEYETNKESAQRDTPMSSSVSRPSTAAASSSSSSNTDKPLGYEKWKAKVTKEVSEESRQAMESIAKKRKTTPSSVISATSVSPAVTNTSTASASLKQSKLNFGAASSSSSKSQLKVDSDGEEPEFEI